jgi:hypothetical protein
MRFLKALFIVLLSSMPDAEASTDNVQEWSNGATGPAYFDRRVFEDTRSDLLECIIAGIKKLRAPISDETKIFRLFTSFSLDQK